MTALPLVITLDGLERFTAAQLDEDIDLQVSSVGLTDADFVVAPTLTALPGEFRRVETIAGTAIGDNIVHMIVRDDAAIGYQVRGFGLFLADGTLFAVYGQESALVEKSALTTMLLAVDIAFPTADIDSLTFGDTNFLNPPATTITPGVVRLATEAEGLAGVDAQKSITSFVLAAVLAPIRAALAAFGDDIAALLNQLVPKTRRLIGGGLAQVDGDGTLAADRTVSVARASSAAIVAGTDNNSAITPAALGSLPRLTGATAYEVGPGGSLIQRGQVRTTISGQQVFAITFPTSFGDTAYDLQLTAVIAAADDYDNYPQEIAGTRTTAGVSIFIQDPSNFALDTVAGFNWRAEGRA